MEEKKRRKKRRKSINSSPAALPVRSPTRNQIHQDQKRNEQTNVHRQPDEQERPPPSCVGGPSSARGMASQSQGGGIEDFGQRQLEDGSPGALNHFTRIYFSCPRMSCLVSCVLPRLNSLVCPEACRFVLSRSCFVGARAKYKGKDQGPRAKMDKKKTRTVLRTV
jgi:hypothetical protein